MPITSIFCRLLGANARRMAATTIITAACISGASAKPADPRPVRYTQPDGTEITVSIRGDEHGHYYLSADGKVLLDDRGTLCYSRLNPDGTLASTGLAARATAPATGSGYAAISDPAVKTALTRRQQASPRKAPQRGPGLFPGTPFPAKGNQKVLVILVDYPNKGFTLSDPYDYFHRMLNQQGFSDYNGTGSARDYFLDNSNRQFTPEFDVYGPVTLSKNYSYYGGNDWWGNDQRPEEMIIEACQLLDDEIDFTQYDRNGDGYIDNVYVFYAGRGEATGGSSDTVWPHSWNIADGTGQTHRFDGVILDRYACSNEWESGRADGIGTFVHEFSHVLGLPDLYATDYSSAFTPGAYSAMDYGPYNNDGNTPPCYGVFERYALDWIDPVVLDGPNTVRLQSVASNKGCIIHTEKDNEYFLLENRQQTGWDEYIPGHGMLIWHIDYQTGVWDSNSVNNTSNHQYVDIEEADGTQTESSRAGDTFPGTSGKTSFTDDTKPSMKTWAGKKLNLPITDIAETDGVITFKVAGGLPDVFPVTLSEATAVGPVSFDIEWTADENATSYLVSVYTKTVNGDKETRVYARGWNMADVGAVTSATVNGLNPETEYYCVVYSSNGAAHSDESNEVRVVTTPPTFDMLAPEAVEATAVSGEGFTANWLELPGAVEYFLTVSTLTYCGYDTDGCDFTGGVKNLPAGWATNSSLTYANTAYSGQAVPSLRLSQPDAYVTSPRYDSDIVGLSFWHRGSKAPAANSIRVYAIADGAPALVGEYAIVNDAPGAVIDIDAFPAGTRAVKIEYNMAENSGSLAIDDICVRYNLQLALSPVEGYEAVSVGSALQYDVEGLQPETDYTYFVTATDGELSSLPSNSVAVTTERTTGAAAVTAGTALRVSGRTVIITAAPGAEASAYDPAGRLVATGRADATGRALLTLRQGGVYIVRTSDKASKIILK